MFDFATLEMLFADLEKKKKYQYIDLDQYDIVEKKDFKTKRIKDSIEYYKKLNEAQKDQIKIYLGVIDSNDERIKKLEEELLKELT